MFSSIRRLQGLVCDSIDAANGKEYVTVFCSVNRNNNVFSVSRTANFIYQSVRK